MVIKIVAENVFFRSVMSWRHVVDALVLTSPRINVMYMLADAYIQQSGGTKKILADAYTQGSVVAMYQK